MKNRERKREKNMWEENNFLIQNKEKVKNWIEKMARDESAKKDDGRGGKEGEKISDEIEVLKYFVWSTKITQE